MTSAKRQREKFKKYVKTSGQTYGNGTVYFCEGDDVVTLEEENFTFDGPELYNAPEFWFTEGVAVALGYCTSRKCAIRALQKIIGQLEDRTSAARTHSETVKG
ncbi:MAG TPA: hypothetical protein VK767_10340 [Bradyrhizobium sp.]|jgi:hypothetical protein|nr:hypothetical protein [Bradyrhizobium sp.]